ncbi:MAG: DNA polymerase family B elongation subunit [Terrestrivirus sp.]|uniref:DNA-directed DNA polymerase n=1 Tax=Terrestrivirus sp. TaxID=2487775 RepID=A0A3G4ZM33_9VIRU|nr:MAG: DNA polymerase family B elongation subunit [Terrestrivirus sp.]
MVLGYDIDKVINDEIKYVDLDAVAQKARTKKYASVYDDIKKENKNLSNNDNDVLFQILDWNPYHEDDDNGQKIYAIRLFGMTKDDRTICVNIKKYTPYFYVKIPENWRASMVDSLMTYVKKKVFPKENLEGLISCQTINKYDFYGFTNYTKFNFLQLTFKDHDSMRSYERVFKKPMKIFQISKDEFTLKLYESNIEPFLRCMHIRNLDSVGWVSIQAAKYKVTMDDPTLSDINIECAWTELNRVDERSILPYRIAAFDIECKSGDGTFPQAYRDEDKIIQIGTTFSKFGENECYFQHIITLGTCDEIPGITVESYETEQEVLIAWLKLITRTNPDIITGYNIFGFDFVYLKDRAKKLGIYDRFSKLTRIKNLNAEWKEKQLASAALGDNLLKYFDMSGRVLIDMMKVIQRDYKLEGYKLDYAASYFIKEQVQKLILKANDKQHVDPELFENFFDKTNTIKNDEDKDTTTIETKSTYGVKEDNYITIYYTDGIANNKHMDGKKFKIKELTKTSLTVYGIINDDIVGKGYKIYWCQAKDDISPKDIFRLQKGTSKDRAIIARYCIMDCALCNKLMAKLQVLTNNIGMANVCNVPLSYLFMRGQGVKIYSLVSKKCREKQHLIPTLAKEFRDEAEEEEVKQEEKKIEKLIARLNGDDQEDDEEEEEEGYEGAIVFPPIPGVYYEPIPVLDYASLYPRSMIHKNLSHECFVIDDAKYGYLPGYNYNIIPYITKTIKQQYDRRLLRDLIKAYDNNDNFIIDELNVDPAKLRRHVIVYDKDHNSNKRYKIADIQADRDNIIMINYETDKFAEKQDGTKGIIPEILLELLAARSKYKKEMEKETDPFKKSILDGLQLAYKVTANSLYGQTGSSVSPIFMKSIAASTTATGREMLVYSKYFIENIYGKMINYALTDKDKFMEYCFETFKDAEDKKFKKTTKEKVKNPDGTETYVVVPEESWDNRQEFFEKFYDKMNVVFKGKSVSPYIVYGDTDSVFFSMLIKDNKTGEIGRDKNALVQCITAGQWASHTICTLLPDYQEQAYEKVLWPFMIITKKRYVGNLYEDNPDKFYQKSMGIVLKRRDNAQIVKIVCGGIVDQILNKHDPMGAVKLLQRSLKDILSGKFQMDKYIITKTLRENYKDRTRIAHAILADRMGLRDPGNKPMSNDRIPYAYVVTDHEVELQGDRIETPDYITSNNLKLDYLFYITNQIQKPATQFLELIIDNPKRLFESYIIREENRRKGVKPIKTYLEEINNKNDNTDDDINNENENENENDNISNDDNTSNKNKKRSRGKTLTKYKPTKEIVQLDSMSLDM